MSKLPLITLTLGLSLIIYIYFTLFHSIKCSNTLWGFGKKIKCHDSYAFNSKNLHDTNVPYIVVLT